MVNDFRIYSDNVDCLDFDLKTEIVDETRKCLELAEKCIRRTDELFSLIQVEEETEITDTVVLRRSSSSASHNSTPGSSPLRKKKTSGRGMTADLSHVRKQFEKASIAEIIARQKKQSCTPNTTTDPYSQYTAPKTASFTINLQVISDLLSQRQDTINHFNEKLFSLFDLKSKDLNSRSDDDLWRKTLRISISSLNGDFMQPIGPIIGLLSHPSHPISQISRDFVLRFKQLTTENGSHVTKQICEEYHQFSFQMIKLLRHNYAEELADDTIVLALQISIEHFMFSHLPGLGTAIHETFARCNYKEDSDFLDKICRMSWCTFDQNEEALWIILNIPEKYRLLTSKYEAAVNELRYSASLKCPSIKTMSLVKVCDLICSAVDESSNSASIIGSEDLVLLLSWVIVQAQIPNILTFFAIISEFLPEDLIRGQAGYVLATLQTCIDYIKSK